MEASAAGAFLLPENSPVVVLDDDASLVKLIEKYLSKQGYPVRGHVAPSQALHDLAASPTALLVVDLQLGEESGLDVARNALEEDPDLAIVMITGSGSETAVVDAMRLGVSDYLPKPFDLEGLANVVHRSLLRRASELRRFDNEERLRTQVADLRRESRGGAIEALCDIARTIEEKHPYMRGHSHRVAGLAEAIGRCAGIPDAQLQRLKISGLLHDIGMIAAPDEALCSNAKLSPEDLARVRSHATLGASLTRSLGLGVVADLIEYHHERLDGTGYPHGLTGSEIPVGALILGLAEAYAALTEDRPYRDAALPAEAIQTLRGTEGAWFPTRLIDALARATSELRVSAPEAVG